MPQKYIVKEYVEDGIYHAYNRGVEKRKIFMDDQDYRVFLHLLKYYLSPTNKDESHPLHGKNNYILIRPRPISNLHGEVKLIAYCLMPNHFHLLLQQKNKDGMKKLMSKLTTTYSMYFNKRHKRVGYLFQGNYKAVRVITDEQLLHLSRYIHLNPSDLTRSNPVNYPYSSYAHYADKKKAKWLNPEIILDFFKKKSTPATQQHSNYVTFVNKHLGDPDDNISKLIIENLD